jgi:hypothetical protein
MSESGHQLGTDKYAYRAPVTGGHLPSADVSAARRAVGQLRQCIAVLRAHHGDVPDIHRPPHDPTRLDIDAAAFVAGPPRLNNVLGRVVNPTLLWSQTRRMTRHCGSVPTTKVSEASAGIGSGRSRDGHDMVAITRTRRP